MKLKTLKMARKLILWNVIIIILPIILLTNSLLVKYQKDFDERTKEHARNAFKEVLFSIDENIAMMQGLLFSVSNNGELMNKIGQTTAYTNEDILLMDQVYARDLETLIYSYPKINALRIFNNNEGLYEFWPVIYNLNRMMDLQLKQDIISQGKLWRILDKERYFEIDGAKGIGGKTVSFFLNVKRPLTDYDVIVEVSTDLDVFFRGLENNIDPEKEFYYIIQNQTIIGHSENTSEILVGKDAAFEKQLMEQLMNKSGELFEVDDQKNKIVGNGYYMERIDTFIYKGISTKNYGEDIVKERTRIIGLMSIFTVFLIVMILSITGVMFKRLQKLITAVKQMDKKQPKAFALIEGKDEITDLSINIKQMIEEIDALNQLNLFEQQLANDAEVKALLSQINEHFIYNMLETFKMMAEIEEVYELSDMITKFGELLRYSMDWKNKKTVPLIEELESIKKYIHLINSRHDYQVQLDIHLSKALEETEIVKMSIQPIIENAFLHGIEPKSEDSIIHIDVHFEDASEKVVCIEITDNGIGMSAQTIIDINSRLMGENLSQNSDFMTGIGIQNINDRIKLYFGMSYGMHFESIEGQFTKVVMRLPKGGKKIENLSC